MLLTDVLAKRQRLWDEKGLVRHMESGDIISQQMQRMIPSEKEQNNRRPGRSEKLYVV